MIEIEIDGKSLQVEDGSTIIEAAHQAGTYIPHFCYHKKLSIAANCRMCLVQVEKAPKPLPACATPVTNGMKVFTHSDMAVTAQKGVMEFLLINHPLDCPICDQGGECQLQDLSVGYGGTEARYAEEKRVVPNKDLGPLVNTDMTRCINCTRCVRFTQEIAGFMELGQAFRGDRAEIMPYVETTVTSELSGNIIDLCPVGALTSKPFRFAARTWELSRRKSIAAHDALGTGLIVQTKNDKVVRVLPLENEEINECWLSDRDRFSYEGLNSPERLTKPMVKQGGVWQEAEWNVALDYVSHALRDIVAKSGGSSIGFLANPGSTLEELSLFSKLANGLGSANVDVRLRAADTKTVPSLLKSGFGQRIADIPNRDRVLLVGSALRAEQPLIAQRLRQAAKAGSQVNVVHVSDDDLLIKLKNKLIVKPSALVFALASILKSVIEAKNLALPESLEGIAPSTEARSIAASLISGRSPMILLGSYALNYADSAQIQSFAVQLAALTGAVVGGVFDGANSLGASLAGALPASGGLGTNEQLAANLSAYVLLALEPDLDLGASDVSAVAMANAKTVVALTAFASESLKATADVLLPITPVTETSGTFVSGEGRVQGFHAAAKPLGEARPAWKVLRVLGNLLNLSGFDYQGSDEIRRELVSADSAFISLSAAESGSTESLQTADFGIERIVEIPSYRVDGLVRRAESLQKQVQPASARANAETLSAQGLADGDLVVVKAGSGSATLVARVDAAIPEGVWAIPAGSSVTASLGIAATNITVEKV